MNSPDEVWAGAGGFEPPFTAPKAGVLPLHHAPNAKYLNRHSLVAQAAGDCYNHPR